jgi:hypothetical protein
MLLKDHALELEIEREFYRDIVILTAPSNNPDKFAILDKIQKLYNHKYKTSIEKLVEGYKKEFGDGKSKEIKINFNDRSKKKISELVKRMPQK